MKHLQTLKPIVNTIIYDPEGKYCESTIMNNTRVINQFIMILGDYTHIYISLSLSIYIYIYIYTHTHITNQEMDFVLVIYNTASEPFVDLCFEAGRWTAWLYLSWDSIPHGCAWKWEASFKKVYFRFGQSFESRCGMSVGTDKKKSCLRYRGARFRYDLN